MDQVSFSYISSNHKRRNRINSVIAIQLSETACEDIVKTLRSKFSCV